MVTVQPTIDSDPARVEARKRIQAKRDLVSHLVVYLVVNAMLIVIWAVTGHGYFWPAWAIGGWGVGLLLHSWDVLWRRPVTEAEVDAELAGPRPR